MTGRRIPLQTGYVAVLLLLAHALLSVYWAAGGTRRLNLLAEGIQSQAERRDAWFIAMVWGVAILKVALALIVLGLTRNWRFPLPRWVPLAAAWGAGLVLMFYALMQIVSLVAGGLILRTDEPLPTGFWAYLLLWAPLWLAIGITVTLTAWRSTARSRSV
jgi:hypothetical protein